MSERQVFDSFCRMCIAYCPIKVTVADGRAVEVVGNREVPEYGGYTCPKGRALPDYHNSPDRLLGSLRRDGAGGFEPVSSDQAVLEVTARLKAIVDRHGPQSVALYLGIGGLQLPPVTYMTMAFFQALGSPMLFTCATIDKPGENIASALHGNWKGGHPAFKTADAWLIVGANPVISKSNGAPTNNPGVRLKEATKNGLKLIVVDPRKTETARRAHVHLQSLPGEDPTILAGMINVIISEDLVDHAFMADNAVGFETLKAAVAPFTPDYVAARAGVSAELLIDAARTFALAKRGGAICSTGPSFSTHSNLSFYFVMCLNTICGRWPKEGDICATPNILLPAFTPKAQPSPPYPVFGNLNLRVKGLRQNASGMPTAALAEEILLEGDGQIKALFCVGGNPISSWSDPPRTEKALRNLDLLVQFDPVMSGTAKLADYVIAPPLSLETPGTTYSSESAKYVGVSRGSELQRGHYTPAIVDVPPGSDLIGEHEFFFRMAQNLGLQMELGGRYGHPSSPESPSHVHTFDMSRIPTLDDLWEVITSHSRIPLDEIKRYPAGHTFDFEVRVSAKDADCEDKLQLAAPIMMDELRDVYAEGPSSRGDFPFLLVSRRSNNFMNSSMVSLESISRKEPYNPACMNSHDMQRLGIRSGDVVTVRSKMAAISTVVEEDDSLRPGVVSLSHGRGSEFPDQDPRSGVNVNLLVADDEYDPISGIPRMSAIPVAIGAA